ncbi:MAG: efflux RND transporter periplasmic adaptor subunit [Sulfuricurvum sp.]|uniref:efflux RND transporter periplasmic adaptor subunit n=1 Tax=Sulfuricurvum sp. TaxID=2025608 RepID=UPI00260418D9|nr:efflux RND transporter periplasmic adaptor subunit [Sulfuricurvum sp.]MDD2368760.1 efflux RND transporter periplasmic adaptor subunit [Sulfuricurvum sp.]MDD5119333.1 efflux RND transporter periplasmic adaptor subunit [Sulfuricurvum sp.]
MKILLISTLTALSLWGDVYATFESQAYREAALGMNASGIVKNLSVQSGDHVKKGALLLELDSTEEQLSLQMAKADLDALTKECNFLSDQYARYEKSAQVFDKNTLDKLKSELGTKLAQKERTRLSVAYAEQKLSKMRLVAPFAGSISEKNIELGDMVSSMGGSPLFKLISDQTKLLIQYDSKFGSQVKVGDRFCTSIDGKSTGKCTKIIKIYPSINTKNRQMTAEADGSGLRPGTFGDGMIMAK